MDGIRVVFVRLIVAVVPAYKTECLAQDCATVARNWSVTALGMAVRGSA